MLEREIHEYFFDPAADLGIHVPDLGLVQFESSHSTNHLLQGTPLDDSRLDVQELLAARIHHKEGFIHRCCSSIRARSLSNLHQVHGADRTLARFLHLD